MKKQRGMQDKRRSWLWVLKNCAEDVAVVVLVPPCCCSGESSGKLWQLWERSLVKQMDRTLSEAQVTMGHYCARLGQEH